MGCDGETEAQREAALEWSRPPGQRGQRAGGLSRPRAAFLRGSAGFRVGIRETRGDFKGCAIPEP